MENHQACNNINWSFSSLSTNEGLLAKSISEILDHGSFSLGRYSADTVAWEKYSCFTHNRRQEELDKFSAPGLVAQKKAYFEEYYRNIRALRGLQAEPTKQKGVKIHPFDDGKKNDAKFNHLQEQQGCISITGAGNDTEILPFEGAQSIISQSQGENGVINQPFRDVIDSISDQGENGAKIHPTHEEESSISQGENGAKIHPSQGGEGSIGEGDQCAIADRSNEETTSTNAGMLQFSDDNLNAELRECILEEKEQIHTIESVDWSSTTGGSSVDLLATVVEHCTKEAIESNKSRSNTASKGGAFCSKIKRSVSQLKKQAAALWPKRIASSSAKKTKLDSRSKSSEKPNKNIVVSQTSLVKDKIMQRASSIEHNPAKADSRPKGLAKKFAARTVSMTSPSPQKAAKPVATVDLLRNPSRNERSSGGLGMKPVESSDQRSPRIPKLEKQSSKARSTKILIRMKSSGNPGPDLTRMGSIRGGRKEKITNVNNAALVRDQNHPVGPEVSGISKAPNSKSTHKIAQSRSVDLSLGQRFSRSDTLPSSRRNMPIWR